MNLNFKLNYHAYYMEIQFIQTDLTNSFNCSNYSFINNTFHNLNKEKKEIGGAIYSCFVKSHIRYFNIFFQRN